MPSLNLLYFAYRNIPSQFYNTDNSKINKKYQSVHTKLKKTLFQNEINAQEGIYNDTIECGKFILSEIKGKSNSSSLESLSTSSSDADSQIL